VILRKLLALCCVALLLTAASNPQAHPANTLSPAELSALTRQAITQYHLKALLVRVTSGGRPVYTAALGDSMTGVPATLDMHFRNGAMAFTYMSTLLLELVDQGKVRLSDKLAKFFPDLPHAKEITLKNLLNMTSGYADYVYQPEVLHGTNLNPFRHWTSAELIHIGVSKPLMFAPGTNWGYSHTNYVILGGVIEKVTGLPLNAAMKKYIFGPMRLTQTFGFDTPQIPYPALHAYSSERRVDLRVPAGVPFYEDSTFWDPSWTTAQGAVQVTDIADMTTSMEIVGSGRLLSKASFAAQVGPNLVGFGHAQPGCSACQANTTAFNYGLGVVNLGPWVVQIKSFAGSGATVGYLRSRQLAIAVVTTYTPQAFDSEGNYKNASQYIFASLAQRLAPNTLSPPK
jgi:CubicO group peptidase (beta-lactamase class C family)